MASCRRGLLLDVLLEQRLSKRLLTLILIPAADGGGGHLHAHDFGPRVPRRLRQAVAGDKCGTIHDHDVFCLVLLRT